MTDTSSSSALVKAVSGVRAGWGVVLIAAPRRVLAASGSSPDSRAARAVLRVLGARHLAQAAVELGVPVPAVAALSAGVDTLHALSGLGLAAVDGRWRRGALTDAAIATAFAVANQRIAARRGFRIRRG